MALLRLCHFYEIKFLLKTPMQKAPSLQAHIKSDISGYRNSMLILMILMQDDHPPM